MDIDLVNPHSILEPFPSTLPSSEITRQSKSDYTGEAGQVQNLTSVGITKAWEPQLRKTQPSEQAHGISTEVPGAIGSPRTVSKAIQADVAPETQPSILPTDHSLTYAVPQSLPESSHEPNKQPLQQTKDFRSRVLVSNDPTEPPASAVSLLKVLESSSERSGKDRLQTRSTEQAEKEGHRHQETDTHLLDKSNGTQRSTSPYSNATNGQLYTHDEGIDTRNAVSITSDGDTASILRPAESNTAIGDDISSTKYLGQPSAVAKDSRDVEGQPDPSTTRSSKVQRDISQPLLGTSSTPDAQLRLEEALSLNSSKDHLRRPTDNEDILMGDADVSEISHIDKSNRILARMSPSADVDLDQMNRAEETLNGHPDMERDARGTTNQRFLGMMINSSKDLMLSQRPSMRIDTGNLLSSGETTVKPPVQAPNSASRSADTLTPAKSSTVTTQQSPPERMTTRVSSGALRHKSVSEILGETPRPLTHTGERTPVDKSNTNGRKDETGPLTPSYGQLVTSPDSVQFSSRLHLLREREKERSKLNTVVFARPPPTDGIRNINTGVGNHVDLQGAPEEPKDYLTPLFKAQAASQSINSLLGSAHKTLSTSNHYVDFHEQQDCRILRRIYQLQNSNRWSLRQIERSIEPDRSSSHWDVLLGHVKWMRTDFREERKWKITAAKNLADWCAEWVATPLDGRPLLQVRVRKVRKSRSAKNSVVENTEMNEDNSPSEPTPDLISHGEDDSSDAMDEDMHPIDISRASAPAAIFSLAPEDVLFGIDKTPISDKLLSELPLYEPLKTFEGAPSRSLQDTDKSWRSTIVPVSKFTTLKLMFREEGPPRKKSRYNYADSDDGDYGLSTRAFLAPDRISEAIPAEKEDVALFRQENKHIRDRIHASHTFRPPSEYNMPSQSFFESRHSSQWTWTEDDELRRLIREYSYNWSLISSCLSSPSLFSSGAERRTPWECFERWVGLDGLPPDMSKTQYFRAYHSRLEAAQRTLLAQQQAAQQQLSNNGTQMPLRRRSAQPVRVDRRRNSKHLALVHAMQKLAKKRETTAQKQQHGMLTIAYHSYLRVKTNRILTSCLYGRHEES